MRQWLAAMAVLAGLGMVSVFIPAPIALAGLATGGLQGGPTGASEHAGQSLSVGSVTASGTAPQLTCSSTTATCQANSSTNAATMTGSVPSWKFNTTATPDSNDLIGSFAVAGTNVWTVDAEGDTLARFVSASNALTSLAAAGSNAVVMTDGAYVCLNAGCTTRIYSNTIDTQMSLRVGGTDRLLITGAGIYTGSVPYIARSGISNDLGDLALDDNVKIGSSGTAISNSIRASATIDFGSIAAQTCADSSITVTGAVVNAECTASVPAALEAGLSHSCRFSATNTAQIRLCNVTVAAIDPASGTFSARSFNP